jgi:soluble lytic murein transglycosylase
MDLHGSRLNSWLFFHLALVLSALSLTSAARADRLYAFMDERGVYHFSNVATDHRFSPLAGDRLPFPAQRPLNRLTAIVHEAARAHALDPALIKAIIEVESDWVPDACSSKGALGLMQLMPGTATDLLIRDPLDPTANVRGGTRYLRQMIDRFRGDIILALAAYNAGPGTVERFQGVPPYPETQEYVRRVLKLWKQYCKQSTS